jgi:hypothetical protein
LKRRGLWPPRIAMELAAALTQCDGQGAVVVGVFSLFLL